MLWGVATGAVQRFAMDPYQYEVVTNGMYICYPVWNFVNDPTYGEQYVVTTFLQNMALQMNEGSSGFGITAYDELTCTVNWYSASDQTKTATSVFAQGSPYATMTYTGTTPLITTASTISSVNGGSTPTKVTSTSFKVVLANGQTWKIYASSSIALTWTSTQLLAGSMFTGSLRIALVKNVGDETVLDTYAAAIPTAGTVSASYGTNSATYSFNWTVSGSGSLLMMALPHHVDILQSASTAASLNYWAAKGTMTGIIGNQWNLAESWPSWVTTWKSSKSINATYLNTIKTQLVADSSYVAYSPPQDTYFWAKGIATMGRLAMIADEVGDTTSASTIRTNMKTVLDTWFDNTNISDTMVYDTVWGGITTTQSLTGISLKGFTYNFGNGEYNDHVIHYGYMVYAAAAIAKNDATWLAKYQEKLVELVHDYMNPLGSGDLRFPTNRYVDWYNGHGWLSGLAVLSDGADTESMSEIINGYYAAAFLGNVIGDQLMEDQGLLNMAMAIRSCNKYWHNYSGNNATFSNPAQVGGSWTGTGIGQVWQTKIVDQTWFGDYLIDMRMIQVIPITPITELYVPAAWVTAMQNNGDITKLLSQGAVGGVGQKFGCYVAAVQALNSAVTQSTAFTNVQNLNTLQMDSSDLTGSEGQTKTNLLYWVATRA